MDIKVSVYVGTSLDGYIARLDGALDWLDRTNACVPEGEDLGYAAFFESVDLLVMGRKTFEKVLTFDTWPYGDTPVVVLTRSGVAVPEALAETVSTSDEAPGPLLRRLSAEGATHVYVDGGRTIQSFLRAGLLDEITITLTPVLLGQGIPLFGPLRTDVALAHIHTEAYPFGYVQSLYRFKR